VEIGTAPGHRRGRCNTAASPKWFTFREAGMQCHTPPQELLPHRFPLDIKDSLKEDARLLFWGFLLKGFTFGFLMGKAFWCGRLWKGKELLKGNC
jgi:hypothetical protein